MALFSRRPKDPTPADDAAVPADDAVTADSDATGATPSGDASAEALTAEPAPSVSISMTSFGGLGSGPATPPPAAPPAAPEGATKRVLGPETAPTEGVESVPGLRDNILVRTALTDLSTPPAATELLQVARQLMPGHLILRVKGDARASLSVGREIPLAVATVGERRFVMAYSSGAALQASIQADGDAETSALAQPSLSILRHVLAQGYDGLIVDNYSAPARAVIPVELLTKALETHDADAAVKTLLAGARTDQTPSAVADALTRAPLWVAVGQTPDGRPGLAEARSAEGERFLELFSHPLELAVLQRKDRAAPVTGAQLAAALRRDTQLAGVVIDPAGPWIRLRRDDLAPVLALPDETPAPGSAAPAPDAG
ncbi:MAG: SseB family protein [Microbacterium aurantiacum]|uniref:SseB family protein n=1 Tax=Microbacterium aurantiacum TaxID=162393 RepID=UPI0040355467